MKTSIPKKSLKRMAHYHYYLRQLEKKQRDFVSSDRLASDLNLTPEQVREDMANMDDTLVISDIYNVKKLKQLIEEFLGYNRQNTAVIAGAGNLGKALLNYHGFKACGLEILGVFDQDENLIGKKFGGKTTMAMEKMEDIISRLQPKIGIITTPPEPAQMIANKMIENGIKGIWNFSLAILKVPDHIVLQNSSLYNDFLKLSHKIQEKNGSEQD